MNKVNWFERASDLDISVRNFIDWRLCQERKIW